VKIDIIHETRYFYSAPVRESVMELWLQPLASPQQRLVSFEIVTDPRAKMFTYTDWLGNTVYHFDVPGAHDGLVIRSHATVETVAPPVPPLAVEPGEWKRMKEDYVQAAYFDFMQPSRFVEDSDHLTRFMSEHDLLDRPPNPLTGLRQLNGEIYAAFDYTPGFTAADSPIDAALEHRKGVCQDFAHIMLSVARRWGIPSRYVSGYLSRSAEARERSTPDASHAWVECYLPSIGWIGFDPTNDMLTGERHVVVGYGRDYADVPPTRGVLKGEASSEIVVDVSVARAKADNPKTDFLRVTRPPRPRPEQLKAAGRSPSLAQQIQLQMQQQQQ
jgi:transglutaminase-like putative cysteine protease